MKENLNTQRDIYSELRMLGLSHSQCSDVSELINEIRMEDAQKIGASIHKSIDIERLRQFGELMGVTAEGTTQLWKDENGNEYVVLCDNSVITREEDRELSEPFFD